MSKASIFKVLCAHALLALLALLQPAMAADMRFRLVPFGDPAKCGETCAQVIGAEGEIRNDTPRKFLEFVAANLEDPRVRSIVFLHSPGGGVDASMQLGRMFRKTGVLAVVARIAPAEAGQGPAVNLPGAWFPRPASSVSTACSFMTMRKGLVPASPVASAPMARPVSWLGSPITPAPWA